MDWRRGYAVGLSAGQWVEILLLVLWRMRMVLRWCLWRAFRRRPRVLRCWWGRVRFSFQYDKRRGWWLWAFAVMQYGEHGRCAGPERRCDVPKKPDQAASGAAAPAKAASVPQMFAKMPTLASFLVDLGYEDGGGPREPSYLLLKAQGGEWQITMKDPTEARQLRLRVTDLGTAWAALEALLTSGTCPWEPDAWAAPRKSRGRK